MGDVFFRNSRIVLQCFVILNAHDILFLLNYFVVVAGMPHIHILPINAENIVKNIKCPYFTR